jgi:hypothetical protein
MPRKKKDGTFTFKRTTWKIVEKPELRSDDGERVFGLLEHDDSTVYLDSTQPETEKFGTLMHEALHLAQPYLSEDSVVETEKLLMSVLAAYRVKFERKPAPKPRKRAIKPKATKEEKHGSTDQNV